MRPFPFLDCQSAGALCARRIRFWSCARSMLWGVMGAFLCPVASFQALSTSLNCSNLFPADPLQPPTSTAADAATKTLLGLDVAWPKRKRTWVLDVVLVDGWIIQSQIRAVTPRLEFRSWLAGAEESITDWCVETNFEIWIWGRGRCSWIGWSSVKMIQKASKGTFLFLQKRLVYHIVSIYTL